MENSFPDWCFGLCYGWCLVSDVQQAGFVVDLGVAFVDDLVFLADRVMGVSRSIRLTFV